MSNEADMVNNVSKRMRALVAGATPGPWFIGEVAMMDRDTEAERPDAGQAYVDDGDSFEAEILSDRAHADARLISAAPSTFIEAADLIDELVAALQEIADDKGDHRGWFMRRKALAALSKGGEV